LPTVLGVLKDRVGSYGAGFLLFAALSALALASLRRVQRGWAFARITVPALELEGVRS